MPDYQKMYLSLFGKVSEAISLLQRAQQEAEAQYLADEPERARIVYIEPAREQEE